MKPELMENREEENRRLALQRIADEAAEEQRTGTYFDPNASWRGEFIDSKTGKIDRRRNGGLRK